MVAVKHQVIKEIKDYRLQTGNGKHIRVATKVIFSDGSELKFTEKLTKGNATKQALDHLQKYGTKYLDKNPYASDAQRRKFHAMAERGEISKKVVREFDKASKGMRLPRKVKTNPKSDLSGAQLTALFRRVSKMHKAGKSEKEIYTLLMHEGYSKTDIQIAMHLDRDMVSNGDAAWRKSVIAVTKKRIQTTGNTETGIKYLHGLRQRLRLSESDADWLNRQITKLHTGNKPLTKNATASDFKQHQSKRLTDLAKMFQGTVNGETRRVLESDYTPKDKYRLGYLVQVKIRDAGKVIPINFDGESYLAADLKNNLLIVGKDARIVNTKLPPKGQLKYLGELVQVDYVTAKKHIEGGKTVRFYHKLGEVTKEMPNLFVDDEGFPIIQGGAYDVWDVGIVN